MDKKSVLDIAFELRDILPLKYFTYTIDEDTIDVTSNSGSFHAKSLTKLIDHLRESRFYFFSRDDDVVLRIMTF